MANTLYEFYTGKGEKLPSIQERAKTFESSGLGSASAYRGSAQQNIALLGALKKPVAPQKVDVPAVVDVKDLEPPEPNVPVQETAEDVQASADKEVVETAKTQRKTSEAFVSDLIKESKIPLAEETERDSLTAQLKESLEAAKGKGQALVAEEEKLGVPENIKKLQELNQQMAQLEAGLKIGEVGLEGKPILTQQIAGKKALLRRQALAEISGVASIAQAVQGNIELAQATAKRAIDLEFAPAEQEISNLTTLLNLNYQNLTIADKKRADQLNLKLQARQNDIDEQKAEKQNISNIMIKAAENEADSETLTKIQNASTLYDAIVIGSKFMSPREDGNGDWKTFEGNDGETYMYDQNTGTVKPIATSKSETFFTDANGTNWNIEGWATDSTKADQMQKISDQIGKVTDENLESKVSQFTPGITADMIRNTSAKTGISWEALMTMVKQEASGGLSNVAKKNNNFGGLTWNNQDWIKEYGGTKGTERPSAEGGNYISFPTKQAGLDAMGALMANYGTVVPDMDTETELVIDSFVKSVEQGQLTVNQVLDEIDDNQKALFMDRVTTIKTATDSKLEEDAKEKITIIDDLLGHSGMSKAVGPTKLGRFTPFTVDVMTGQVADFVGGVEQLISQETLNTLLELKKGGGTLGALSDQERIMLQNAASKIGGWRIETDDGIRYAASEASFKKELEKIKKLAQKAVTNATIGEVQIMKDGSEWIQNADGSFTKIK